MTAPSLFRLGIVLAVAVAANPVVADDVQPAESGDTHVGSDAQADEHHGAESPEDVEQRKMTAHIALWALIGITLAGLGLVLLTMVLGRHTRRVTAAPLPERTKDDPYWHLKPERPEVSEESVGEYELVEDDDTEVGGEPNDEPGPS